MDPNLQVPYADSWTVGIQRTIGRSMAFEARYVGTRSRDIWAPLDFNEINIFENGFLKNSGPRRPTCGPTSPQGWRIRASSTADPAPGTVPLPIMFAYFQGAGDPNNAAAYTSTNFRTNNTFLTPLATFNPNPFSFANNLQGLRDSGPMRRTRASGEFLRREP